VVLSNMAYREGGLSPSKKFSQFAPMSMSMVG